ncbi:MAG: glycosyltransferase family 2 protein [Candidatus Hodarchaeota archaeon]
MTDPKISIIFPTYFAEKVIYKNLKSIENLDNLEEIEVVIIDNGSLDSTKEIIKSFKNLNIRLIEQNKDLGFARAINLGAPKAKGEFLFITNDDVDFPKDFFIILLNLYKNLKKDKEIIISPAVVFTANYINYFGAKIHFLGFSYTPNMYKKISKEKSTFKTLKIAGCSMFLKKKTFIELNGFDTFFFMYHEDTDFSLRAIRKCISIYTTNETTLHHQKIHMILNDFTYFYIERNRYLTIYKNIDKIRKLIPFFLISEVMLITHALSNKILKLRLKVYKFLIQNFRQIKYLRNNKNNSKEKKLQKQHLDIYLDSIILGRLLSHASILKLFLKIMNLIL